MKQTGVKVVATNRQARHRYTLLDTYECGLVLTGSEVKSLREAKVQLTEAWGSIDAGEAWLHGLHIVGGMVVMLYFIGPGARLWQRNPEQFTNRIEYTGLYWHFVDLVWIFLFPILYLL